MPAHGIYRKIMQLLRQQVLGGIYFQDWLSQWSTPNYSQKRWLVLVQIIEFLKVNFYTWVTDVQKLAGVGVFSVLHWHSTTMRTYYKLHKDTKIIWFY